MKRYLALTVLTRHLTYPPMKDSCERLHCLCMPQSSYDVTLTQVLTDSKNTNHTSLMVLGNLNLFPLTAQQTNNSYTDHF